MRLILFGAPGVGKGTQATSLAKELGIVHISCGNLLREAVKSDSALGGKAKGFMKKGELVPDDLVSQLIFYRIGQDDTKKGFILDGYPRNIKQAVELDQFLIKDQQKIDKVIYLEACQETIMQRLIGRRLCSNCQANFHIKNMPPQKDGICDYCGDKLYQRPDDKEETIKNRLKVYHTTTLSLLDQYQGRVLRINADGEAGIVLKDILVQINAN
ncbi:MAG: adenylate kinase [Candidatus Omnitrophota bacterium]